MTTLYIKSNCQFSARVLAVLDAYQIPFEEKNVADPGVSEELILLGGKKREPFLVDGDTMLYESEAIIQYLEDTYGGKGGKRKPKIHFAKGTEICSS